MEGNRGNPACTFETGYNVSNSVYYDGAVKKCTRGKQYVLILSTFEQNLEGDYKF